MGVSQENLLYTEAGEGGGYNSIIRMLSKPGDQREEISAAEASRGCGGRHDPGACVSCLRLTVGRRVVKCPTAENQTKIQHLVKYDKRGKTKNATQHSTAYHDTSQ